jgi:hypothetical protein
MIAVISEKYTVCPFCQKKVWRGIRRFGPPTMTCNKCGNVYSTNLKDWNTMSSGWKAWYIFLEWFFPSYYRGFGFPEIFMVYSLHVFMVAIPIVPVVMMILAFTGEDHSSIIGAVIFLFFPLFHFLWLKNRIRECTRYINQPVDI